MSDLQEYDLPIAGMRIHVRSLPGAGANPIVLIHGWGSSGRMWLEAFDEFRHLAPCVTFDFPGHGGSSRVPPEWYSLSNMASLVWDVVQALGLPRPILVGHSLGGEVALALAAKRPADIARLIAIAPSITGDVIPWGRWLLRPAFYGALRTSARQTWRALGVIPNHPLVRWIAPALLTPFTLRDVEDLALSDPEASLATGVMATQEDISALLPAITAPCLVVIGLYDVTSPPRQGRLAAAHIPGALLLELPTRHHPFAERPDLFYPPVVDFLRA